MTSLVNISIEFDQIWGSYGEETSQKQPKMISSSGSKTLEHWKLGKYKSATNETWPIYVPLQYFSFSHKIRVSMDGRVGGTYKKPAKQA